MSEVDAVVEALGLPSHDVATRVMGDPALLRVLVDWSVPERAPATEQEVQKVVDKLPVALRRPYLETLLACTPDTRTDAKEAAVLLLSVVLREAGDAQALAALLLLARDALFATLAKARTAKLVRVILDAVSQLPNTSDLQARLTHDFIDWSKETKRTFLRQRLQLRLCGLQLEMGELEKALGGVTVLLKELKKLDDKPLLVEALLLESRVHRALHSVAKAKASLTGARTNANAIYCPQKLQGELDMQSGIINADEHDYRTAFSYFYEAFEGFNNVKETARALLCFKYMLMAKIMTGATDDVAAVTASKGAQAFADRGVTKGMLAVAKAHRERSLQAFTQAREAHRADLIDDPIVQQHFEELYGTLLEQNLIRLIEPFSRVEIAHIAALINLPLDLVERKLSQMILDKKFAGILDQGAGTLIIFDDPPSDRTYAATLDTIAGLNQVVDTLFEKATKILA